MSEGEASGPRPTGSSLDPFGFGEAWARALGIREPLSGDVTQAIRAAAVEHLGQMGLINLSIGRSADPELEQRIVAEVASYGRQLGWVLEALDALVRAQRGEAARDGDDEALDRVGELGAKVRAVKRRTYRPPGRRHPRAARRPRRKRGRAEVVARGARRRLASHPRARSRARCSRPPSTRRTLVYVVIDDGARRSS